MTETEPQKFGIRLSSNFPFILMTLWEIYFIVSFLLGALGIRGTGFSEIPYWWASVIVKVGLGCLVYLLFVSERKYTTGFGVLLVLLLFVLSIVVYYTSRDFLFSILGGVGTILLTTNTLMMIRLYKKPRSRLIEEIGKKKWQITITLTILIATFQLVSNYGWTYIVVVLGWIVYCRLIFGKPPSERISSRKFFEDVKS